MITIVVCILVVCSVEGVRVSPKLDFDDSNAKSGIRSEIETRPIRDYKREHANVENIEIVCTSNNCNATKTTSGKENGESTDVLVHVKTNVGVGKTKNDTTQNVPDVPIVVGTKTSTTPSISNNRRFNSLKPTLPESNYPSVNLIPPPSSNNGFIQSARPNYFHTQTLQSDSQVLGYPNFVTYAPQFQDNNNVQDFYNTIFNPPINRGSTYHPISPTATVWNAKGVRTNGYNPVEFTKTYNGNPWSPVNVNRNYPSINSRVGGVIPRWTPCVCDNSYSPRYPTTGGYSPASDDPAGVSGKLASLA